MNPNPFDSLESKLSSIENSLEQIKQTLAGRTRIEQYYSIAQAARKLNVAEITLYRNCQSGKIPSKKIGQRVMIPGSFLEGTSLK